METGGSGGGGLDIAGLLMGGTMWFMGMPGLLTGPVGGIANGILWGVGGLQLLAQWATQGVDNTIGVNQPDHGCYFSFWPKYEEWTNNNGIQYVEFETFVGVHVWIPLSHTPPRTGWMTFPLSYNITAFPNWHYPGGPKLSIADTLQIAVKFGNGGQSDAGSGHDTGHSYNDPNVVNVGSNTNFHGYLQGCLPDNEDWYSFAFNDSNKKEIYVDMTPPNYVDFDLQLYNSDGSPNGLVASSNNPAGQAEHVMTYSNLTGPWYVRIYPGSDPNSISHSGVYSCSLSSLTGDINLDGIVDIYDAIKFAGAFSSSPGSPNWNPNADINNDGTVDIYDAVILSANFGRSYQTGKGVSGQQLLAGKLAQGGASVLVNPGQITVFKGEVFTVSLNVASVTDLQGWEFKLYWNSTVLNCTNAAVQTPSVWQNNTINFGSGLEPNYNATYARYWQAQAGAYPASSFNGSMTMVTLTFQALQPGTTSLTLADVKLGNSTAEPIACSVSSGSVTVRMNATLSISVSGAGTTSPAPGNYSYAYGTNVTVTATPSSGYAFGYWSLDGTACYNNPITLTMTADHSLTAYFVYIPGRGCVLSNTRITMADGKTMPVQTVKPGDQIMGYDIQAGTCVTETVTSNEHTTVDEILSINHGLLYVTPTDQPIYTDHGWVRNPQDLMVGWKIYNPTTNTWTAVQSVTRLEGHFVVYDLRATEPNTFIGNGILLDRKTQ